jgi:hypothetical protein
MSRETVTYIVFGIVLAAALLFDLGLISKKNKTVTLKRALVQTIFWVALAFGFFVFYGLKMAAHGVGIYKCLFDGMELKY